MKIKNLLVAIAATALVACSSNSSTTSAEAESASATEVESTEQVSAVAATVYELPEGEAIVTKEGRITMVDFNADWCVPCKKFRPTFDAAAEKYGDKIDFVSVNMDKHPEIVEEYGVEQFPTIVFIMPDGTSDKHVGLITEEEFFKTVDEHLARLK